MFIKVIKDYIGTTFGGFFQCNLDSLSSMKCCKVWIIIGLPMSIPWNKLARVLWHFLSLPCIVCSWTPENWFEATYLSPCGPLIEPIRYPKPFPDCRLGHLAGGNLDVFWSCDVQSIYPLDPLRAIKHGYLLPGKKHEHNSNLDEGLSSHVWSPDAAKNILFVFTQSLSIPKSIIDFIYVFQTFGLGKL